MTGFFILDSRSSNPAVGLRQLFVLKDKLDWVINERALAYGHGEHPKHRLTNYHLFFIDRIQNGERVLDVGCGYGAVARSIAHARPNCTVVGVEMNRMRLEQACSASNPPNLTFFEGDATCELPAGSWDVVVLSNLLEHIEDRIGFLVKLQDVSRASRYLIRVPLFERDWQMPFRRELGANYFSDDDHKIEYRQEEFLTEIESAELYAAELITLWGEIWADCRQYGR